MYGKVYVIVKDLGSILKEGMVCKVYDENTSEFYVEIMNPPENLFLITYAINKKLVKYFHQLLPLKR